MPFGQIQLGLNNAFQNFLRSMRLRQQMEQQQLEQEQLERDREQREAQQDQLTQQFAPEITDPQTGVADPGSQFIQNVADAGAGPVGPQIEAAVQQQAFQTGDPFEQVQAGRLAGFSPAETTAAIGLQETQAEIERRSEAAQTVRQALRDAAQDEPETSIDPGEFAAAADELGLPSELRTRTVRQLYPTEAEELESELNETQRRLQVQGGAAVLNGIERGMSLSDFAASDDPNVSIGMALVDAAPDVRQLRREMIDNRNAVRDYYQTAAERFISDRGLVGEVEVETVRNALRSGNINALPQPVQDEFDQFQRSTTLKAQVAMASNVSDLPTVQAIDQRISAIMDEAGAEPSNEQVEQLNQLFDAKADIAADHLQMSKDAPDFPFPTSVTERNTRVFGNSDAFRLTVTPEGRSLVQFVLQQGDGNISDALSRARELRAQTAPNSADRESFNLMIEQLERLDESAPDEFIAPR